MIEDFREINSFSNDLSVESKRKIGQPVLVRLSLKGNDEGIFPDEYLKIRFLRQFSEGEGIFIQWDPALYQVDRHIEWSSEETKQINLDRLKKTGWETLELDINGKSLLIPFMEREKYNFLIAEYVDHA